MSKSPPFERLVRFQEKDGGTIQYGDLPMSIANNELVGSSVDILAGDFSSGFQKTGAKGTIKHVELTSRFFVLGLS